MNIFNSLGSNYNLKYVIKSLILDETNGIKKLTLFLEKKYQGKVLLFYKARQAITTALRLANLPENSEVAITGFTCIAVVEAVEKAGYKPVYLDIDLNALNFTDHELINKIKINKKIKAVIIQNTLGYPCEMKKILDVCKKNNLILIEDLAHSVGSVYENGIEAGAIGDFAILSFSQDKMIDAVSGGALIIKNSKFQTVNPEVSSAFLNPSFQDKYYPLFTWIIKKTYPFKIGKFFHYLCQNLFLLKNPMKTKKQDKITNWHAMLALEELRVLEKNMLQRKKIAQIYAKNIKSSFLSKNIVSNILKSSNLRFPIFTDQRDFLIDKLQQNGVYVSDIWYDAPVCPRKFLGFAKYPKSICPNAEIISSKILNLPTHKNVSEKDALKISKIINSWAK